MKFDYKEVPVPREARKLPKDRRNTRAYKVRPRGEEVIGTVMGFEYGEDSEAWVYIREGKVFGGHTCRHNAAEALARS
jgi:hypothetical protein